MDEPVTSKPSFHLSPTQATLISFVAMVGFIAVFLLVGIGYRDSVIGLAVLGAFCALLAGIAIFLRPQWGAFLLIITVYSNMSTVFSDNGLPSVNKALVAFVLISILVNRMVHKRPFPRLRSVELILLAYGFVWMLSAFFAVDQAAALGRVFDFVKDYIIVITIILALTTFDSWKQAIWVLILTAMLVAALSAFQALSGNYGTTFFGFARTNLQEIVNDAVQVRQGGPIGDPNYFGLVVVMVIPIAVYYFLDEKRLFYRGLAGITALLLIFAMLNTYSRGAFVALVLALSFVAMKRRISPALILGLIIAFLLLIPLMPGNYTDRIGSLLSLGSSTETAVLRESSFRGRTSEYISGLMMFMDHPLLGVGVENYRVNYQSYSSQLGLDSRTEERAAHSLYIEALAETGFIGFTILSALLASLMLGLQSASKKLKIMNIEPEAQRGLMALQCGLIAFLAGSIFLHGAYIRYLWLLVALCAAGIHLAETAWENYQHTLATPG
jgi:putative inorganic carbon (HCO3(-)) transporter